ncbi:acetyl coenzyme A synthetase (ADP forming), alpha domain protein [Methanosalsum zhilinae DSM 4017]|uniref:acetate--CoA ligase (ADP-forming) n=1 Tax=Methanosalsum zhilinae (strain DSM 4017 / NBRC 107636 / OCM 62 / WeN5) TaxID=679901 RepID=F7XKZ5_METZD|nr:acetate--CoA ligase [Methanosalsum zhilinae]AEH60693.1 acetyl coenzyme A synthetase (ADP forming), alpha domain protein [Methanosalsum zhilinae DSM 4017]
MLEKMFNPDSVAVIGASRNKEKVGYAVLHNLIESYKGKIFPINPEADEILGIKTYSSIEDIPLDENVDLAVIVVPAKLVPGIMENCGKSGIKNIIIISAGFKETGIEGARLERKCVRIAKKYDIRFLGPNCLGIIDTSSDLNASFSAVMAKKGNIALISQSGAICTSALDWADNRNVGFSKFISLGNKADLAENDFLSDLIDDSSTDVVAAYLEGVKDGPGFIEMSRRVSKAKPLIVVKAGRTAAGSKAVSSHTGTLAGSDEAYDAAFVQGGVIRADSLEDLLEYSRAFSMYDIPQGDDIAIITNAGGLGILTADECQRQDLSLAGFEEKTIDELKEKLPPAANIYNPVDVLGDADPDTYEYALNTVLEDENVDGIILLISPQAMTDIENISSRVAKIIQSATKPVLCSFVGGTKISAGEKILTGSGIPNYTFPERAVASMRALSSYRKIRKKEYHSPPVIEADRDTVARIIEKAQEKKQRTLGLEAFDILKAYNIPVVEKEIAKTLPETIEACESIGYPVAMKILSPEITHKSDVGGIRLNLTSRADVEKAYDTMISSVRRYMPHATINGVQIQRMIEGGREVIIGMNRDVQFGPLIMFGLGGTYVEFLKDVTFGLAPLTENEANHIVSSIRTYPLLAGVRGEKPHDIGCIIDTLLRISQLSLDFPQILEFEVNPLVVMDEGKGCTAIDMRLTLRES